MTYLDNVDIKADTQGAVAQALKDIFVDGSAGKWAGASRRYWGSSSKVSRNWRQALVGTIRDGGGVRPWDILVVISDDTIALERRRADSIWMQSLRRFMRCCWVGSNVEE